MKNLPRELGSFTLGCESVTLEAHAETGGSFWLCHKAKDRGKISVGLGYSHFDQVASVLLHEALEYAMTRADVRYSKSLDWSQDMAGFTFVFDHCQFSEFIARVAPFVTKSLPALKKAWKKQRKN